MPAKSLYRFDFKSPVGVIRISGDAEHIHEVIFADDENVSANDDAAVLKECAGQLDEYFSGKRISFSLPLHPEGTDFQKRIWSLLQKIPFGKTISYLDLAIAAGDRNLTRAVGLANGSNKLAIVIPCHRVIGSGGNLTGYAGGLWRKKWLLDFEQRDLQPELFETEQLSKKHEGI